MEAGAQIGVTRTPGLARRGAVPARTRFFLRKRWWGLIFVLPVVAYFAVFSVFPVFFGFWLSLTDDNLLDPPQWVGLDNFINLLHDEQFLIAFRNTLVFVAGATVPVWIASLLAALLFDQAFRGREVLKAVFFLPVLPPVVVVGIVWRVLLHPNGVMTWLFGGWRGVTEIRWLADTVLAPLSIITVHDWAVIPFFMLIWLAGLAGIAPELRDAAHIDGATAWRTFWHIELPQLRSTAVLVGALSAINAFQTFTLQYVITPDPGGPANSTLVLGLLVLKYGFLYFRMGDAAAISVVMFAMILAVTAIQLGFNRRAA
jgi:multiple sugar transport system permease protein